MSQLNAGRRSFTSAADEYYYKGGRSLASPLPGEEIVISGMAAVIPNCRNVYEFKNNLFNKVNMVASSRKWDFHSEVPTCSGTISEIDKYDCGFFGVHERQSHSLDTMARIFQEKAVEAIFDAGLHPSELEGSRTGVYVGVCSSENDKAWYFDNLNLQNFAVTGSERSMIAHRLSYFLKLKGPSTIMDTACSSSCYALENAYKAIRLGEIDNAIVGGTNLCLYSNYTMQFYRLGMLSNDGFCKAFDAEGNGYARSEGIAVVILQKAKSSKRIYAQLVHVKTNSDGFKEEGITFPSVESQTQLLNDFFEDCTVDRFSLSFLEAHGTGTKIGDPQECAALDNVLTSGRKKPLLIGSVKASIGHTEPASGLCSIIKCILTMETGYIPPNINFDSPRDNMKGLVEGRIKVVVEKTPLEEEDALMGVNNFGFGGANTFLLLKRNSRKKIEYADNLPRLICVSGRTEEAILVLLDQIVDNDMDVEYIKLLHEVFAKNIQNHLYRGYIIVPKFEAAKSVDICPEQNKPLYLAFGELNNWCEVGRNLMALPAFKDSILSIQERLTSKGLNILNILLDNQSPDGDSISSIGPIAVQIAIIDVLNLLDVKGDISFGCSFGELVSAYYNKTATLDETLDCAFNLTKNRYRIDTMKPNSIILEIGDNKLSQIEEVSIVRLFGNESKNYLEQFLTGLGSLYVNGYNPQISRLYPRVDFPVSRGTPMISPSIRWKHTRKLFVPNFSLELIRQAKHGIKHYRIELVDSHWAFVADNLIDGECIFPSTGYLYMVWETFSIMHGVALDISRVSLKNCRFIRATRIPEKDSVVFKVSILAGTGQFEVIEGTSVVVTGMISFLPGDETEAQNFGTSDLMSCYNLTLKQKEIYKELRLRGCNYRREFRAIEECDLGASKAYIKWRENWIVLMENMLQLKALQSNSRSMQVPIFISRIDIAPDTHFELVKTCKSLETALPALLVYSDEATGNITCGGITIAGMITNNVARKKVLQNPILVSYEYVPNSTHLELRDSVRINTQIILENTLVHELKVVELIDEFSDENEQPLSPIFTSVLEDELLVQPSLKILSAKSIDVEVEVENKNLEHEKNCQLVIASKIATRPEVLKDILAVLKEDGFLLSRESRCYDVRSYTYPSLVTVTVHQTPLETIVLVRKQNPQHMNYIEVDSSEDFSWITRVQDQLNEHPKEELVLYSSECTSGIMGLVNCLRREPGKKNIRCVFTVNNNSECNLNSTIYSNQLKKNLAMNVYKNGQWGTYRYLPLGELQVVESEHCFANFTNGALRWTEGPLKHDTVPDPSEELIYVYYSSLNFRNVMNSEREVNAGVRLEQRSLLGAEFSGRNRSGTRVMGWSTKEALANLLLVKKNSVYQVPEAWTMEEAATVPLAYATAIYALILRGHMRKGENIFIHNGAGDVGQAAIHLALHCGCRVFTTVDSEDKRNFIKKSYPQLKDENIGTFLDESFEQMINKETDGKGAHLVLNCLSGEQLFASVRCLITGGRFLEVGESDLRNNNHLNLLLFRKQASFHGITFNEPFSQSTSWEIQKLLKELIEDGAVKPLKRYTFHRDNLVEALEFVSDGRRVEKALVKLREPEECLVVSPSVQKVHGLARYYCDPFRVYVIIGGLGGFGLELANFLVLRGAKKLVLTSRKGITTGYQQYRIKFWQSYGVMVKISTAPVAKRDGCKQLIEDALQQGRIAAIFNLALILADAIFENQTSETFTATFEPKAIATKHLDDLTRTMCSDLEDFVVFSSVSCGRGNAGQSNYGMANSVMEQICETRKRDGYPALAIEWGTIGEAGIAADNETLEVSGTMQQPISSCIEILDNLLTQRDASIVASMMVAEKRKIQSSDNVVDSVLNIIGLKDAKYVSQYSSLAELGLDSMISVEIKLALEKDFQISLSIEELRKMTLASFKDMQEGKCTEREDVQSTN